MAYSWIPVCPCFSCCSCARAVPDGLGSVNLSRNFLLRFPYFVNVVYLLLSIYVAAHSAADPLKREIMYLVHCPSKAPAASAILLSTCCHQQAFDKLKEELLRAPLLEYFDPTKRLIIKTDASNHTTAAVIFQEIEGELQPLGFM